MVGFLQGGDARKRTRRSRLTVSGRRLGLGAVKGQAAATDELIARAAATRRPLTVTLSMITQGMAGNAYDLRRDPRYRPLDRSLWARPRAGDDHGGTDLPVADRPEAPIDAHLWKEKHLSAP
jgi:hypothetical protein